MMATEPRTTTKKPSLRSCVGCGESCAASETIRVVFGSVRDAGGAEPALAIDLGDGAFGRGAHVHPRPPCIARAIRGGFSRAFKARVDVSEETFLSDLSIACDRRLTGLLVAASRSKGVALGADAACESLETGSLAILATDAGNVATRPPVTRAVSEGRAFAWNTKAGLGSLFGREEIAVVAVPNGPIAIALRATFTIKDEAGAVGLGLGRMNTGARL